MFQAGKLTRVLARSWTRSLASEVDRIEASLNNQLKETHSIEAQVQSTTSVSIPRINDESHVANDFDPVSAARNHRVQKRISEKNRFTTNPVCIIGLSLIIMGLLCLQNSQPVSSVQRLALIMNQSSS